MLDIGWTELLVIAVILIVVVGPKDLPPMLRAFGKMTTRLRKTAGEFRAQFDEALREAELDEVRKTISDVRGLNPANSLREAINPLRQMGQEIKADLQRATAVEMTQDTGQDAEDDLIEMLSPDPTPAPSPAAQPPQRLRLLLPRMRRLPVRHRRQQRRCRLLRMPARRHLPLGKPATGECCCNRCPTAVGSSHSGCRASIDPGKRAA